MSNTNKSSAIYQYQHLTKYTAHFAKHRPTLMEQFMKVKSTQKVGGMAAAWFFTLTERYTKGIFQKENAAEKGF